MKRLSIMSLMLLALFMLSVGCTSASKQTSVIGTRGLPLVPIDYEVIGDTSAEETRMKILFVDWEHLFQDTLAGATAAYKASIIEKFTLEGDTKKGALYKALAKIPQADRLIEPRYTVDHLSVLGIFQRCTVKVTAKAIKYTKSAPLNQISGLQ